MRKRFARTFALALAVLLGGCWAHSYPLSERFLAPADLDPAAARRAELFVDMNGTFYPDGWRSYADGAVPKVTKQGGFDEIEVTLPVNRSG